ncbi:MAG: TIGR02449 family protein [Gammaproteobacteria bacterium]|nr:TIGR02449 family protein [Gammaproteobacteria bacterium]
MNEADITQLENQIDELIKICSHLKDENAFLRERQELLVEERARLIEKADMARNRVEGVLTRLKAMEQQA